MSSLIFYLDEANALVATDTLATLPDGRPSFFCSKALYLPHLRLIVAGTGMAGFADDWVLQINQRLMLAGIENVDKHAPRALSARWEAACNVYPHWRDQSTTIYHFGISELTSKIVGYAYRSTNRFTSEPRDYGSGMKPNCSGFGDGNVIEQIPGLMREQRQLQESSPPEERTYIGGEMILYHLTSEGCYVSKLDEFDDFSAVRDQLLDS